MDLTYTKTNASGGEKREKGEGITHWKKPFGFRERCGGRGKKKKKISWGGLGLGGGGFLFCGGGGFLFVW